MATTKASYERHIPEQNATTAARDGVEVVFVGNVYDPDSTDEQYETTVLYLIREQGQLRVESDHWTPGGRCWLR